MNQNQFLPNGVKLTGIGTAVPSKLLTNQDLEKIIDTNSEWIESRTGIKERRICDPTIGENSLSLAVQASLSALKGINPSEIDLIIVATSTPDYFYPSTACRLQAELGAVNAFAFDLSAACTGFVYALVTASHFVQLGSASKVLVVGVDIHSKILDWTDRSTCILFGDAAGAVLLERTSSENNELLSYKLHADGNGSEDLSVKCVTGEFPLGKVDKSTEFVQMNGRRIYHFAIKKIPEAILESANLAGISTKDLDYLICHQANQRILDSIAEKMEISPDRCISNIAKYGNTSAASIPLVWNEYADRMQEKSILSISGFGAGLTWGSLIWKWKAS